MLGKAVERDNIQRRIYDIINVLVAIGCVERLGDRRLSYKGFDEIELVQAQTLRVIGVHDQCRRRTRNVQGRSRRRRGDLTPSANT